MLHPATLGSGGALHSERPALLLAGATHGVAEPSIRRRRGFFREGWGRGGGAMVEDASASSADEALTRSRGRRCDLDGYYFANRTTEA